LPEDYNYAKHQELMTPTSDDVGYVMETRHPFFPIVPLWAMIKMKNITVD
jgi:hypothetical protein